VVVCTGINFIHILSMIIFSHNVKHIPEMYRHLCINIFIYKHQINFFQSINVSGNILFIKLKSL